MQSVNCTAMHLVQRAKCAAPRLATLFNISLAMQAFREDTDAWLIAPMYVMVHNVRQVACQADDEATRLGRKSDALENCGTQLQKCFAVAVQGAGARPSGQAHALLPEAS